MWRGQKMGDALYKLITLFINRIYARRGYMYCLSCVFKFANSMSGVCLINYNNTFVILCLIADWYSTRILFGNKFICWKKLDDSRRLYSNVFLQMIHFKLCWTWWPVNTRSNQVFWFKKNVKIKFKNVGLVFFLNIDS